MADNMISVIGTVSSRLPDIPIVNQQIIFVKDQRKIALDLNDKRTFYNEIITLDNDQSRSNLSEPINGCFYFVISTAVLWFYKDNWIPITTPPQNTVFVGTELPGLGRENILYVNKTDKNISIWDEGSSSFIIVGDATRSITNEDIDKLF